MMNVDLARASPAVCVLFSPAGSCIQCSGGEFSAGDTNVCAACIGNTYSGAGAASCTSCGARRRTLLDSDQGGRRELLFALSCANELHTACVACPSNSSPPPASSPPPPNSSPPPARAPPGSIVVEVTTPQVVATTAITDPRSCGDLSGADLDAYVAKVCAALRAQAISNGYLASQVYCSGATVCQPAAGRRALLASTVTVNTTIVFLVKSAAQVAAASREAAQLVAQLSSPSTSTAIFSDAFPGQSVEVVAVKQEAKKVPVVVRARPPPPRTRPPPPNSKCAYAGTYRLVAQGRSACAKGKPSNGEPGRGAAPAGMSGSDDGACPTLGPAHASMQS